MVQYGFYQTLLRGMKVCTCVIPAGKAVFIPIHVGSCWNDNHPYRDDKNMLECAMNEQNYGTHTVTLNGIKLNDLASNRVQSPYFNITITKESETRYANTTNPITGTHQIIECKDCPVGTFRAIADGYSIFLAPLAAGKYDVAYTYDTVENVKGQPSHHAAELTYHLFVKPLH